MPLLPVALVAAGCGKSEHAKRYDAVDAYRGRLNGVRTLYAPALARPNTASQSYAHAPVDGYARGWLTWGNDLLPRV